MSNNHKDAILFSPFFIKFKNNKYISGSFVTINVLPMLTFPVVNMLVSISHAFVGEYLNTYFHLNTQFQPDF